MQESCPYGSVRGRPVMGVPTAIGRRPASGRSLHAQRVETDAAKREFGSDSCLFSPPWGGSGGSAAVCAFRFRPPGTRSKRAGWRRSGAFFGAVCFEPASRARLRFKAVMRSMTWQHFPSVHACARARVRGTRNWRLAGQRRWKQSIGPRDRLITGQEDSHERNTSRQATRAPTTMIWGVSTSKVYKYALASHMPEREFSAFLISSTAHSSFARARVRIALCSKIWPVLVL